MVFQFRIEAWKKVDSLARANPDIQKLTAMMKECAFMNTEIDANANIDGNDNAVVNDILMNNVNNMMAIDEDEDRYVEYFYSSAT